MNRWLYRYFPLTVSNPFLFFYLKTLSCIFFFCKRKKNIEATSVRKILLVQLAHLGDVILLKSCIPSIKKKYPEALIGVLIGSWCQELFEDSKEIRQHVFDHWRVNRSAGFFKKWIRCITSFFSAWQSIKACKYDLSIDLSLFYPNSHLLTWLTSIPHRIGFISGGGGELLTKSCSLQEKILPILDEMANLFQLLDIELNLPRKISERGDFWIFHPCSGDKSKDLPEDFWKSLYLFFKAHGQKVVFTGKSPSENSFIEKIACLDSKEVNLCGKLSLSEVKRLIAEAKGIICVDTFISHLASNNHQRIFVQFNHPLHMIRWKPRYAYSICHRVVVNHENDHFSRRLWNKTFRKNPTSS